MLKFIQYTLLLEGALASSVFVPTKPQAFPAKFALTKEYYTAKYLSRQQIFIFRLEERLSLYFSCLFPAGEEAGLIVWLRNK